MRAFRQSGGVGPIAVRARFPGGRGLGFSGAARVGGLVAACVQQGRSLRESRPAILRAAGELEGHFDNVAASLFGGVVAVAGGRAVRIPLPRDLAVVVWIPDRETPTPVGPPAAPRAGAVRGRRLQRRPRRAAGRGAGGGRRRRAARRDRGPPAPGPAARPRPRHPPRDRRRARGRRLCRRGCRAPVRRRPRWSSPRAREEIAAALPAGGRTRVLAIADVGATVTTREDDRRNDESRRHEDRGQVCGGDRRRERHRRRARPGGSRPRARAASSSPTCRRSALDGVARESGDGLAVQCDVTDEAQIRGARRPGRGSVRADRPVLLERRHRRARRRATRATRSGAAASTST